MDPGAGPVSHVGGGNDPMGRISGLLEYFATIKGKQ